MNRGNVATSLKVKSSVGHFLTCVTFTDSLWEEDKLPVSLQVYHSHDVTQMTNVSQMCQ